MGKLILVMIDGISADLFERSRAHLPHLDGLARAGTQIAGLAPEMCATSCPGRTSIIAGTPPAEHGIYGNFIHDADAGEFRWANPYDVAVKTLPQLAREQGLDVANLGYGMVRPEDCTVYTGPWWVDEMIMRGKDDTPLQADENWRRAGRTHDPQGRLTGLCEGTGSGGTVRPNANPNDKLPLGMLADGQSMETAGALIATGQAPDFVLLEVAITDYYLHRYGPDHDLSRLSLRIADAQLGQLIARMRQAGRLEDYNFALLSDHGHAPMPKALFVDTLLGPDTVWSGEGSVLFVRRTDARTDRIIADRLLAEGLEAWNNDHLPAHEKDRMMTFVAPKGGAVSFERSRGGDGGGIYGPSKYVSNHGMRPGTWEDYRFCIFSGPDIAAGHLPAAEAIRVAPTLARILGVHTPWPVEALPVGRAC